MYIYISVRRASFSVTLEKENVREKERKKERKGSIKQVFTQKKKEERETLVPEAGNIVTSTSTPTGYILI